MFYYINAAKKNSFRHKGLELFNLLDEPIPPRFSKNCLKQFFLKIITTDFDIKIEQNTAHMKDSTKNYINFFPYIKIKNINYLI